MDWGISAAAIAIITFIVTQVNGKKMDKLNDRIAKLENEVSPMFNEMFKIQGDND